MPYSPFVAGWYQNTKHPCDIGFIWSFEAYMLNKPMKYKPKTSLRAVFMSKEGISKHPTWHIMLLTPQTPHQHAVYNLVSQLSAQQTKMFRPRAALDEKFANVERFNTKVMRMSELKCRHGCEVQNIVSLGNEYVGLHDEGLFFSQYEMTDTLSAAGVLKKRKKMKKQPNLEMIGLQNHLPIHGFDHDSLIRYRYGTFSIIFSTTDILQSRVSKIKEIENEERMREKDERSRNEGDDKIIEIVTLEGP